MSGERESKVRGMFDDSVNFRELGGYPAADGKRVRYGVFYRSGMLGLLQGEDLKKLEGLGIRVILDFRSKSEAAAAPDPVLLGADYCNVCALYGADGKEMDFSPVDIEEMFQSRERILAGAQEMMELMYGRMAFDNPGFRKLFEELECGRVPVLFHCSAGKDRTGVAAILVLLALGVDEETVLRDYELTNVFRRGAIERLMEAHSETVKRVPETEMMFRMMEGVDRRAAELVLEKIKGKYGSYERYFEAEYGLTGEKLADLRERYLE